jgi:hypothetical protein
MFFLERFVNCLYNFEISIFETRYQSPTEAQIVAAGAPAVVAVALAIAPVAAEYQRRKQASKLGICSGVRSGVSSGASGSRGIHSRYKLSAEPSKFSTEPQMNRMYGFILFGCPYTVRLNCQLAVTNLNTALLDSNFES